MSVCTVFVVEGEVDRRKDLKSTGVTGYIKFMRNKVRRVYGNHYEEYGALNRLLTGKMMLNARSVCFLMLVKEVL